MTQEPSETHQMTYPPTALGWFARFMSLALVAALLVVVGWKMSTETQDIAFSVEIQADKVRMQDEAYLVPIDITNDGSRTARKVDLELSIAGQITSVEIDMIGASETVRKVVSSAAKPRSVDHRIVSYEAS